MVTVEARMEIAGVVNYSILSGRCVSTCGMTPVFTRQYMTSSDRNADQAVSRRDMYPSFRWVLTPQ